MCFINRFWNQILTCEPWGDYYEMLYCSTGRPGIHDGSPWLRVFHFAICRDLSTLATWVESTFSIIKSVWCSKLFILLCIKRRTKKITYVRLIVRKFHYLDVQWKNKLRKQIQLVLLLGLRPHNIFPEQSVKNLFFTLHSLLCISFHWIPNH